MDLPGRAQRAAAADAARVETERRIARPDGPRPGQVDDHPLDDEVWQAVRALPDRQRTAIVLRYVADLPEADIAEALHVSRGTVASNLSDARKALARFLDDDETQPAESTEVSP